MQTIFGDMWCNRGDVPDLVALRRRGVGKVSCECGLAVRACSRIVFHHLVNLVGRHEVACLSFVTGLCTACTRFAAWSAWWFGWGIRWVGRWGLRGILRVLVEACLQFGDTSMQCLIRDKQCLIRGKQ
jgi:hypothetical protein